MSAEINRLTRKGRTVEPVSRGQIRRRERGQGNEQFPCSADHEQDWQPYPVDPYTLDVCGDHAYIHTVEKVLIAFLKIAFFFVDEEHVQESLLSAAACSVSVQILGYIILAVLCMVW